MVFLLLSSFSERGEIFSSGPCFYLVSSDLDKTLLDMWPEMTPLLMVSLSKKSWVQLYRMPSQCSGAATSDPWGRGARSWGDRQDLVVPREFKKLMRI